MLGTLFKRRSDGRSVQQEINSDELMQGMKQICTVAPNKVLEVTHLLFATHCLICPDIKQATFDCWIV